jgi:NTP pyrophosphatase (non-canonical NTP hydrolase)
MSDETLDTIQAEVDEWTRRFRPTPESAADPMADALALAEEAGEVCRAVLKRAHGKRPGTDWTEQVRLEAADVAICLLSLAANEGWSLADAIAERWAEVQTR